MPDTPQAGAAAEAGVDHDNDHEEGQDNDSLGSFAGGDSENDLDIYGSDDDLGGEPDDEGNERPDVEYILLKNLVPDPPGYDSDVAPTTPAKTPPGWEGHVDESDSDGQEPEAKRPRVSEVGPPPADSVEPLPSDSALASVHPASASRTRIYTSPDHILQKISPLPGCRLSLNFNDWRWVSSWRKNIDCDQWLDELSRKSYSQVFDRDDWKEKLRKVHEHAWTKWEIAVEHKDALKLPPGTSSQRPGEIPQEIFDALQPIVAGLEVKKRYGKRK